MSAIPRQLLGSGAKYGCQMVCETSGNVEQRLLTGGLPVNDSGFDQVTRAIKLMEVAKVFETVLRAPSQDMTVQITILLLGGCQELDRPVHKSFEPRISMML